MNTYKPHDFSEMIGVSVKTLQRWDNDGKLKAYRTPTDRRYYTYKQTVIVAHKDRFIRFGYEWVERFLKSNGVEIIVVNNEKTSPEQELVNDLISIIHVFSCRIYGLRKYKKQIERDEEIAKELQNRDKPNI